MKIGFLGMGVMGLPMAKNVVKKSGCEVLGYDVVQKQLDDFAASGGKPVSDPVEIYKNCDVILQILPTHPITATPWSRLSNMASPAISS